MESGADLDQGRQAALDLYPAFRRRHDAAEQLEDRALPRPVGPDDAEGLTATNLEAHVLKGPELARTQRVAGGPTQEALAQRRDEVAQGVVQLSLAKFLVHAVEAQSRIRHRVTRFPRSTVRAAGKWRSRRRKPPPHTPCCIPPTAEMAPCAGLRRPRSPRAAAQWDSGAARSPSDRTCWSRRTPG